MKEKKQFFIPRNYEKKFEWIPGISGWEHLAFIPVVALDYFILTHTPFDFSNKIIICAVTLGLPWVLMGSHPVRENVSLYKHITWKLKFLSRQRQYHYKKEGYKHAEPIQSKTKRRKEKPPGGKEARTRPDSLERYRERDTDNVRQQNGPIFKSIGH
ncbi:hypothetical protein SC499_22485 [Peribacillus simplex]|uniref:hypothetical protein n=1 Tax=Peribacillus simplex TaxID=1478 RepID=UPI00298DCB9D|nr:hypothetical protein [Peribacillus simplex]MDW7617372.1 hypothetical protein [Peribacillus simplex]